MAQWNTAGLANNLYVRSAFQPFENAAQVPAVQDYLNAVKASGGSTGLLGEQATTSFLLWATAAKSCGSTLTRQCMVNYLSKVHDWTGGGLHAPADPGANLPPKCGMILKLTNTTWSQYYPKTAAQFDCNDKYLFKVSQANWGTTLGAGPHRHQVPRPQRDQAAVLTTGGNPTALPVSPAEMVGMRIRGYRAGSVGSALGRMVAAGKR